MIWPRIVEVMLSLWLMLSPFIFQPKLPFTLLSWVNVLGGALIAAVSLATCAEKLSSLRLVNALLMLAVGGIGYVGVRMGAQAQATLFQSNILVALLLLLHVILPSKIDHPPRAWRAGGA